MCAAPRKPDLSVLDLDASQVTDVPTTQVAVVLDEKDKKMIALLIAMNSTLDVISRKLGLEREVIGDYVSSEEGAETIIRMQTSLCPDPRERIKKVQNLAVDALTRVILKGKNEANIIRAATDLLDRGQGKAVQITENRNLNVNVTDMKAADQALAAQKERLNRLEITRQKLIATTKL
jgi:hypothetical protein